MSACVDGREHDLFIAAAEPPVTVTFCLRCEAWCVQAKSVSKQLGVGLDAYRDAITDLAAELPDWDGAAGLYDLHGHATDSQQ